MAGFVDFLTAVMTLLIVADVVICQIVYSTLGKDFARLKEDVETTERLRAFGFLLAGISPPILVLGLVLDSVWPLPGSYNFIYGDMVVYIGTLLLVSGILMVKSPENVRLLYPLIAVFTLFVVVYGADILYYSLGQNPLAAGAMIVSEGLGGLSASVYLLTSRRTAGYTAIAFLLIAIAITVTTNIESIFEHTATFRSWFP